MLPAGSRLADEDRPGRHCFLLIEGSALAQAAGKQLASLTSGSFIGWADNAGLPRPPAGVTVRLVTPARVLVLDADRLAALIAVDPEIARLWSRTVDGDQGSRIGRQP
jgi:CRP-like cAMP-binding protein